MAIQNFRDWKGDPINKERHGGARATVFIFFMVMMTNLSFYPIQLNLVTYLQKVMHMDVASSATAVTNFYGTMCAFALLGGFLSDSYISRFKAVLIFGPMVFLGFGLLALQAHMPSLKPPACEMTKQGNNCYRVQGRNAAVLYLALYSVAFSEGCIRANLPSFGADQFDGDDVIESRHKSSYFNWLNFSISVGALIGLVFIVWIEDSRGWDGGYALSGSVMILGVMGLASGFKFYRYQIPRGSPLTRMTQVFVAAFRKRKLSLPATEIDLYQEHSKEEMVGEVLPHSKGFKCLDKASILHGSTGNWYLCTVTQVEETKIVLRMLPIFISAVIAYIPIPQLMTFTVQQGNTMNTRLGKIHVSPASLMAIPIIFQAIIVVIYDRLFVPFARKVTGYRTGITHLQRISVGFMSVSLATCTAAVLERKRKIIAHEHGLTASQEHVPMSVMWLSLQFFTLAITDVFAFVGLFEFFNSEVSRGMKSLGTATFWCILGLASFMGSILVDVVNDVTKDEGTGGWLGGNNLNQNYLDRYYWFLSILGFVGLLNFVYWARRYTYVHHNLDLTG